MAKASTINISDSVRGSSKEWNVTEFLTAKRMVKEILARRELLNDLDQCSHGFVRTYFSTRGRLDSFKICLICKKIIDSPLYEDSLAMFDNDSFWNV